MKDMELSRDELKYLRLFIQNLSDHSGGQH